MEWYLWVFFLLLFLHILCCVLIFLGISFKVLKVRKLMFVVALFLPFWGPLLVLILHLQIFFKQTDRLAVGVEKFQVESELLKGISQDENKNIGSTVSMEEALIINSPKERRSLIMDILNDNPKEYVEFLKMAGNNEDTEVVHYAVTAMEQISKENDKTLWEFEQKYSQNREDLSIIRSYSQFLWNCLEQGLMQGYAERMNRQLFDTLIQKAIQLDSPRLTDYIRCIKNAMLLKNYTEASVMLEKARDIFGEREPLVLLQLQYYADMQEPEKIQTFLDKIERENVYISSQGKEVIAFWRD
jgi:hypothetical protein